MDLGKADVRRMRIVELRPAAYNPRLIKDDSFEGLSGSIDRFGLLSLIVWNERTKNIVGGHQRYKKLVRDGETETDVIVVDLDDDEEVALNIALNNPDIRGDFTRDVISLLEKVEVQIGSSFNDIGLSDLHKHLKGLKFDVDGSKKGPVDAPGDYEDRVPESSDSAVISCPRCGSLWKMADNKVIFNALKEAEDSDKVEGRDG